MNAIEKRLTGRNVYRIDGSLSQHQRKEHIDRFRNDATGAIFIIQIKAGGVGLNLQDAVKVYITSPSWNPSTEIQAIGRAHRTGQTKSVKVCRLITDDIDDDIRSIEQSMIGLQEAKALIFKDLLGNVGDMAKIPSMGKQDIDAMKKLFMTKEELAKLLEIAR